MKNYVWMLGLMLCTLTAFTSCDEDDEIGLDLKGRWFGDMDMCYGNEKAIGSEIEFIPYGWGYDKGTGEEVDYYRRGTVIHHFDYHIHNGVIYMDFDDPDLDCSIVDYRLNYNIFKGYIISDNDPLAEPFYFNLRNYDRYWDQYGYGRYYNVKGDKFNTDQTVSGDSIATQTGEEPRYIRGVNRQRD